MAQVKTTPWGVSMGLTAAMTLSLTSRTSAPSRSGRGTPGVCSTVRTGAPHRQASRRSLGLSHRNSPASWR